MLNLSIYQKLETEFPNSEIVNCNNDKKTIFGFSYIQLKSKIKHKKYDLNECISLKVNNFNCVAK